MDYVNKQKNITIDLGCVTLDETTTMTADGPFEHHLHGLNHLKWTNVDVEMETAAGVVPYIYDKNVLPNAIQWATGLELALFAKDMNRTFITTDHPNAGPFTRYPRVIKWLMSKKAREALLFAPISHDRRRACRALPSPLCHRDMALCGIGGYLICTSLPTHRRTNRRGRIGGGEIGG